MDGRSSGMKKKVGKEEEGNKERLKERQRIKRNKGI
jgi:hypothetical protein